MHKYLFFSFTLVISLWISILIAKLVLGGQTIVPVWVLVVCLIILTNFLVTLIVAFYRLLKH